MSAAAERPWLDRYPPGVPADIDLSVLPDLVALFEHSVSAYADRPALDSFGVRMTYGAFGAHARAIASGLQRMGLKKGDRVAMMMPNVMAYPVALMGALIGGFTVVNVNPLYTPRELTHQLNDSGARMIFVLENFAHTVSEALPDLEVLERAVVVKPGDLLGLKGKIINFVSRRIKRAVKPYELPATIPFGTFLSWGGEAPMKPAGVTPDDIAFLQYTGGTTGVSKGATLTHRNVAANVLQCESWLFAQLDREARHVMFTALPLYHILALTACCMFMLRVGAMQVLIANPRDIPGFIKALKTTPPSILVLVNTLYNALAQHPDIASVDFSKLELCISGGMATQASVAQRWKEITGQPIIEGYGLSETSPLVCVNRLDIEAFTGGVGYPVSSTHVSIRTGDGEVAPQGQPGELCVKGPQVTGSYWRQPEETARSLTSDGYFRTGDVAVMDPDGMIRIVDRMKDMIAVSGLKVFPNEVEDVLACHPQILEVAVIGVPDAHSGEAVAAYIVPRDSALTSADVQSYARERLAPYKMPRHVEFRETLPKSNVGKILRRELRDEAAKGASRE